MHIIKSKVWPPPARNLWDRILTATYIESCTRDLFDSHTKNKSNPHRCKYTYPHYRRGHKNQITKRQANHCPGSVMFLLESDTNSVLYTGDVRAEPWYVNALTRCPSMIPYTLGRRQLSAIYADTTFAYRGQPYIDISENSKGVEDLLRLLEQYPTHTVFVFNTLTTGYEEVLIAVAERFKEKIHMDSYHRGLYASIASSCNENSWGQIMLNATTEDAEMTRFHACDKRIECVCRSRSDAVFVSPVVELSEELLLFKNGHLNIKELSCRQLNDRAQPPGKDSDTKIAGRHTSIFVYAERRYLRSCAQPDILLPANIVYKYSRHSSYREIHDLVKALKPVTVYPCYFTRDIYRNGFRIRDLFGDIVSVFTFDDEMANGDTSMEMVQQGEHSVKKQNEPRLFGIRAHAPLLPTEQGKAPLRMAPSISDHTSSTSQGITKSALLELLCSNRRFNEVSLICPISSAESCSDAAAISSNAKQLCEHSNFVANQIPYNPNPLSTAGLICLDTLPDRTLDTTVSSFPESTVVDLFASGEIAVSHKVCSWAGSIRVRYKPELKFNSWGETLRRSYSFTLTPSLQRRPPRPIPGRRRILKPPLPMKRHLRQHFREPSIAVSIDRVVKIQRQLEQDPDAWFNYPLAFR